MPETDPVNNGGHFHYKDRPISLNNQPLQHSGDYDPTPFGVYGFTSKDSSQKFGIVKHEMPEVSGRLDVDVTLTLPYPWYCTGGCYTDNSWRYEYTYDIGIQDLSALPDLPSEYSKVRTTPDTDHPNSVAFTGTQFTLQLLPNDMSLPKGGIFDVAANWKSSHSSHREGKDADINQGGIECDSDLDLQIAVDQLLRKVKTSSGNTRSPLLCELGTTNVICSAATAKCRKHIDFEGL